MEFDLCEAVQNFGKGIGNPNRYLILDELLKGSRTVTQISEKIGLSQPATSQHLRVLKTCRLVHDEKKGKEVVYSLNVPYLMQIFKELTGALQSLKSSE